MISALFLLTFGLNSFALSPYEPMASWKNKSVKVCWGDAENRKATLAQKEKENFLPWTVNHKKWIKTIVTKEFSPSETGIHFVGWEDCGAKADGQIVLFRIEPEIADETTGSFAMSGGRATLGQGGVQIHHTDATSNLSYITYERSTNELLNYVILNTRSIDKRLNEEDYIKLIALHEFGHSAGLRHQHVRIKNVKEDPNCKKVPEIKISEEPAFASTRFAGPYDHNSVMNYCYINVLTSRTGLKFTAKGPLDKVFLTDDSLFTSTPIGRNGKKYLFDVRIGFSAQDKHALKCMYVFDETKREKECSAPK